MKEEFIVKYSFKEVMNKLKEQDNILREILNHAKQTNGRVNMLEKKSIGLIISNNPFKFALIFLIFIGLIINDIRNPLFNLIIKLLGF